MRILLLLAILLSSCVHTTRVYLPERRAIVDPELERIFVDFAKAADQYGKLDIQRLLLTTIQFEPTHEDRVLATCELDVYGLPFVKVDPIWWQKMNKYQREMIIFHELGHCYLGRDHRAVPIQLDGVDLYGSIMNPKIIGWKSYKRYKEYYLYELFNDKSAQIGAFEQCRTGLVAYGRRKK